MSPLWVGTVELVGCNEGLKNWTGWLQLLTELHEPLLELVVAEAFEAAIDVAGQENLDIRLHEMRYAMPPCNKVT